MSHIFKRISDNLLAIQRFILITSSVLIVLALAITAGLRYILQTGVLGLQELVLIPAFWMYFIGAAYGTHKKEHITADIIDVMLKSDYARYWLQLIVSLINFILTIIFAYWSVGYLIWSVESGSRSGVWNYPMYIPQSAILFGFVLMSLYTLIQVIEKIRQLYKFKSES